jgi:hypothetical protein
LVLAVLLLVGSSIKADTFSYTFNSGAPTVTIIFDAGNGSGGGNGIPNTSPGGTSVPETTRAGLFTVTDNSVSTPPPASSPLPANPFQAFCLDLWHSNNESSSTPTTFTGTAKVAEAVNFAGGQYFPAGYTPSANLANQLNYLAMVYDAISKSPTPPNTATDLNAVGALQLAIWALIDQKPPGSIGFRFTGANSTMLADYQTIIAGLGGMTGTNAYGYTLTTGIDGTHNGTAGIIDSTPFLGYQATGKGYSGAVVITADGAFNSTRSQNLLTFGTAISNDLPEPSTMAIAGLGALGFMAYGWRRRKQS